MKKLSNEVFKEYLKQIPEIKEQTTKNEQVEDVDATLEKILKEHICNYTFTEAEIIASTLDEHEQERDMIVDIADAYYDRTITDTIDNVKYINITRKNIKYVEYAIDLLKKYGIQVDRVKETLIGAWGHPERKYTFYCNTGLLKQINQLVFRNFVNIHGTTYLQTEGEKFNGIIVKVSVKEEVDLWDFISTLRRYEGV